MTDDTVYVTAPYVKVGFQQNILKLGFGSIQQEVTDNEQQRLYLKILALWKTPITLAELHDKLMETQSIERSCLNSIIDNLLSHAFVIPEQHYQQSKRYSRNLLYYSLSQSHSVQVQQNLAKKHVTILGAGGIGNYLSYGLAAAGIGNLCLIDGDTVELSNLTRQALFTESDIGKSKVDVLKRELLKRNSEIKVDTINSFIDKSNISQLGPTDLIILSADSPGCISNINRYCIHHKMSYINVGYVADIAVWGPLVIPGVTGCYDCQTNIANTINSDPELNHCLQQINATHQAPSVCGINMLASSSALLDIIKFLGEFGKPQCLNQRIGVWTHNLTIETQSCEKNPDCASCGELMYVQ